MPLTSARPFERLLTDRAICIVLMLLAAGIYTIKFCPTIFTDDCGEIATGIATWGVMHPTGYPLYCLVGGALVHILSRGEPAWRIGFLSAIPAGVTVGLGLLHHPAASGHEPNSVGQRTRSIPSAKYNYGRGPYEREEP